MIKHDYAKHIYYENIDEEISENNTTGDASDSVSSGGDIQREKTPENFFGEPKMPESEHLSEYNAANEESKRIAAAIASERANRDNRQSLVLALLGLVFSLFFGVGIFFSVPAFFKTIRLKERKSKTLKWAKNLSITGIVLNFIVILAYIIFASI